MILIDAKAIKDDGANYVWSKFADGSFIKKEIRFVNREQIDNAPKIDAIPIKWLEKKIDEYLDDGYNTSGTALRYIIDEWRRENGDSKD